MPVAVRVAPGGTWKRVYGGNVFGDIVFPASIVVTSVQLPQVVFVSPKDVSPDTITVGVSLPSPTLGQSAGAPITVGVTMPQATVETVGDGYEANYYNVYVGATAIVGVVINPGDNIQAIINANPAGTTYTLLTGIHTGTVDPNTGDTLLGLVGSVLDGGGSFQKGIASPNNNIGIRGLEIRNYGTGNPDGHGIDCTSSTGSGWLIEDCQIHHCGGRGISMVGINSIVRDNTLTYNGRYGIAGGGWSSSTPESTNWLIEGNEIAYNNTDGYDPNHDAGGTKFVHTNGLILRNNDVHDNFGNGLWPDIDNINALIEDNNCYDNDGHGIFYEISFTAVIRNNTSNSNGKWGIYISTSSDVEVYGNSVINNTIMGGWEDRGVSYSLENLWVHDNTVSPSDTIGYKRHGVFRTGGMDPFSVAANNRFDYNTYDLSAANPTPYQWNDTFLNTAGWQGYGHDLNGTWL